MDSFKQKEKPNKHLTPSALTVNRALLRHDFLYKPAPKSARKEPCEKNKELGAASVLILLEPLQ